ncbi:MAG: UDP-N-acetylmuramate dehydrogenase [Gaiellales bacterium]|nr:UDP-N-acetylmuramate dehydrogenase [Gaiellales bacterium]
MTLPGSVERDVPFSRLTTVGTGGPARFFAKPGSVAELAELLAWRAVEALDMAVIGLGSNLLASDEGFDGLVVRLSGGLAEIERDGDSIRCGGGASLAAVVKRATQWGLSGIEFGGAIPGTVGGAVRMNAGAYGGEMRDVLADALVLSAGTSRDGGPEELAMSYRRSNVTADEVVASATLALQAGDPERIGGTVKEMQRRRREAQPAGVRTFGSVWKNPSTKMTAGMLLERCDLKGFQIGGARISPVHANFIENTGDARSADVIALMAEARRRARERFGITLEHEVQLLGRIELPEG